MAKTEYPQTSPDQRTSEMTGSPETANAQQAIEIIEAVTEKLSPKIAAYLVYPNMVLTLAGARSMADGIFYSTDEKTRQIWLEESKQVLNALNEACPLRAWDASQDKNFREEDIVGIDFLTEAGVAQLGKNTNFLPDDFTANSRDPKVLFDDMVNTIKQRGEASTAGITEEDMDHVAIGILLGYPDKAIVSGLQYWHDEDTDDIFRPRLMDADIRGANYYDCPQPVYSYSRELVNDPDIKAHEQLWSKILRDFYTSDFFKSLEKNPEFASQIKALTEY